MAKPDEILPSDDSIVVGVAVPTLLEENHHGRHLIFSTWRHFWNIYARSSTQKQVECWNKSKIRALFSQIKSYSSNWRKKDIFWRLCHFDSIKIVFVCTNGEYLLKSQETDQNTKASRKIRHHTIWNTCLGCIDWDIFPVLLFFDQQSCIYSYELWT